MFFFFTTFSWVFHKPDHAIAYNNLGVLFSEQGKYDKAIDACKKAILLQPDYADAYNKDSEFYAFTRRLNAYKTSFSNKGDILLVDPDSDFFRYLNNIDGK